jgi:hypothetical protein
MPTMTNNEPPRTEPAPADRDWFGGRRWTGILAVGVVILVALCIVLVLVVDHGTSKKSAVPSQSATPTVSNRLRASALPTSVPTAAPAGTRWNIYQTVALPTLPGAGPAKVDGAIAIGYVHSPLGALVATANESYRFLLAPDNQWRRAAAAMLAPGTGTNAWIKTRSTHPYGSGGATSSEDSFAQIAGFQFVSYTPTDAVIQIVTRDNGGNLQVGSEHVIWDGKDWKYMTARDGGQLTNVQQVDSLAGFIQWNGV